MRAHPADPFIRFVDLAEGSYARRFQGTGLDLAIGRGLAQLHGGMLGIESAVGQGTKASLTLPKERIRLMAAERNVRSGEAT